MAKYTRGGHYKKMVARDIVANPQGSRKERRAAKKLKKENNHHNCPTCKNAREHMGE